MGDIPEKECGEHGLALPHETSVITKILHQHQRNNTANSVLVHLGGPAFLLRLWGVGMIMTFQIQITTRQVLGRPVCDRGAIPENEKLYANYFAAFQL